MTNPLDYQSPRRVLRHLSAPRWQPYFVGQAISWISGLFVWIILCTAFPNGPWLHDELLGAMYCFALGGIVWLALLATIYYAIASRYQTSRRHFCHGLVGGLLVLAVIPVYLHWGALIPDPWNVPVFFVALLLGAIILGCFSAWWGGANMARL